MGCHFLLQDIFPNQGSNPGFPHCGKTLYCLSHQGSRSAFSHSQQRPYPGPPGVLLSAFLEPRIQAREESIHSIAEPTGSFTMLWGPAEEGAADASTPPGGGREMQPGAKDFCNSFPIGKNHYFATWFVPGTPVFLLGESQGRGSLVGCRLWGRTESDTTEVT